ncbi:YhgE/Pip domain-containing protein [Nocardioides sp. dk4132]|uniref:YhgE/Pip domain-containing protein n=1 Tax=unclassified Nocardioides TaxID=2615069 RepID=UPI00129795D9|nr:MULTISPECIES: YhgE/Pip domain-containing protein [unclassified Nocardioides]MQW78069.1 YhgE/Pip domain-containing protein [Nocardioides sp. dk4132]QGA08171.1 YhgE/Pip domain-containing protein [Nocardioides sp. dk884]
MIVVRLAITELRRITAGVLPKMAVLAMIVIPSLYAGLYVYANEDPYDSLERVPAALVVQDQGAQLRNSATGETEQVNYGDDVARRLLDGSGGFGWVETTQKEAEEGVDTGRYDAALIIGPRFSADLVSTSRFKPRKASLDLLTNDATNYLATTIATTIADDVRTTIAQQVGTKAASRFLQGLGVVHTDLTRGVRGAQRLVDGTTRLSRGTVELVEGTARLAGGAEQAASGAARLSEGTNRLSEGAERLQQGTATLASGLQTLRSRTATLPADTARLASGAQRVADGNRQVATIGREAAAVSRVVVDQLRAARRSLADALAVLVQDGLLTRTAADQLLNQLSVTAIPVDRVNTRIQRAAAQLDRLSRGSAEVASGARRLAAAAPTLVEGIERAASGGSEVASGSTTLASGARTLADDTGRLVAGADELSAGANRLASSSATLRDGGARLESGTTELRNGLARGLRKVPDLDERTERRTAQTIGDPVGVRDDTLARAGSYGAGLAPFFMSLAVWIGAYMLFLLVRPLSVRSLAADGPSARTALGGLVPPAVVAAFQTAVMFAIVRFGLDIDPAHELATAAVLLVASVTFVAIIQALNAWLGTVGEFIGLVLMLVQLVTAGGTFPWETIPEPLRSMHWFLPMTYAVDSLRQTLYGGELAIVARNLGVLLGVCLIALLATALAARRQKVWTPNRLQPELVL